MTRKERLRDAQVSAHFDTLARDIVRVPCPVCERQNTHAETCPGYFDGKEPPPDPFHGADPYA